MKKHAGLAVLCISCIICFSFGLLGCGHTHKYSDEVVAPTCTEQGYTTHKCSCGEEYKDSNTAALGHDYIDGVCSRCNDDTTRVTEEQWRAIFDRFYAATNYTFKSTTYIGDKKQAEQLDYINKDKLLYTNSGYYSGDDPDRLETVQYYLEIVESDKGYVCKAYVRKDNDVWETTYASKLLVPNIDEDSLPQTLDEAYAIYFWAFALSSFKNMGLAPQNETNVENRRSLDNAYSLFEYNSVKKAYKCVNLKGVSWVDENEIPDTYMSLCDMEIYIREGHITKLVNTTKAVDDPSKIYMTVDYEFGDYDKTAINMSEEDKAAIDALKNA